MVDESGSGTGGTGAVLALFPFAEVFG